MCIEKFKRNYCEDFCSKILTYSLVIKFNYVYDLTKFIDCVAT